MSREPWPELIGGGKSPGALSKQKIRFPKTAVMHKTSSVQGNASSKSESSGVDKIREERLQKAPLTISKDRLADQLKISQFEGLMRQRSHIPPRYQSKIDRELVSPFEDLLEQRLLEIESFLRV
ncbi:hypothetical protein GUITHDRAFT_147558 [Guillardia theta CCMP2712]|uniref:Uncharacterized protein n=1 Tax=Guillardia theta (strain CCMP2712) TaxID=905079 RepID=L1IDJ6_GUITC|nr:hypothetical protein GUITHDRAFT_147558 [Guillardia theta CCMP2712]EKX33989.1 hypothetical protein GUITHDRAFT_147558 [Guillardia theta CCMP2712]|eukprot:XP_005820969.1 hypothetical protein GUITHDRAFT_147558 [Guillardia theta CCMP2712]